MTTKIIAPCVAVLAFVVHQIGTAQPTAVLLPPVASTASETFAGGKEKSQPSDKDKKIPDQKLTQPPATDVFAQAPVVGNPTSMGFNPQMMGDLGSFLVRRTYTVAGTQTTTNTTSFFTINSSTGVKMVEFSKSVTTTTPVTLTRTVLVPVTSSAGVFKIGENESPRPVDRVFGIYNFFGGIRVPDPGPVVNSVSTSQVMAGSFGGFIGNDSVTSITSPALPRITASLHRETVGFEKTFLDGFASVEIRLPILQQQSNIDGFGSQNIGDLTIIGKYAALLDNDTGNVLSAGLSVTVPTGPGVHTSDGYIHSTLVQPWFGYIWNFDRFYVQAFHSLVVPTDIRDVTLLFNDVGVNFWLYRGSPNQVLNFVVPMIEAHVTTPLNHRGPDAAIFVPDTVVMTGGVHFGVFRNGTLSLGVATPVTGPRVFNIEALVAFNWRY